jgi:molybdopterin molybdotransferase
MVWADGLAEIPEKTTFKQGEIINYYPFNEMML